MAEWFRSQPNSSLYERDLLCWSEVQARAIEDRRWDDVDVVNVADEVRSLGRQLLREAEHRTEILVSYLLKWRHLAEYRGRAWKENIDRQRREIAEMFERNPTLAGSRQDLVAQSYETGRQRLRYETYFDETDFPSSCPFTVDQVFDVSYYPEELDAPARDAFPTARLIA